MERPLIIVDLDNVVYDWVYSTFAWIDKNDALGMSLDEAMARYSQWSVWKDINMSIGEFMRWWRLGIEAEEIYAKGPAISGARDALWRLSDAEWDIFIATSRLTKFGAFDKIVANTAKWLNENNIPYRSLAITDKKTNIKADAIVDDRADNMSEEVHKRTFLFDAPHNRKELALHWDWPGIVKELI